MAEVETLPMWIGGKKVPAQGSRVADVHNPATNRVVRQTALGSAADINAAVEVAAAAFPAWKATTPLRRSRILNRFRQLLETPEIRDELCRLISEEHGKTPDDAAGELQRGIEVVEFACGAPHLLKGQHSEDVGRGIDSHSMYQPLGVCAGVAPFNFPAMVPMWMFPVAIACGNTFVMKPSERVPSTMLRMAEIFHEAGLPAGVLNVVPGDKEAVDALLVHPKVKAISFVGSTPVAHYIYTTGTHHGKRVQALGGAKNHAVVLPDADIEFTTDNLVGAGFGSAGQRCMAISVVVAVGGVERVLIPRLVEKSKLVRVGPASSKDSEMGPLITSAAHKKVRGYIDAGVAEGASLVLDGRDIQVPGHEEGYFVGPTIFDNVTPNMSIYQDEIFGPVLVVVHAENLDEAIALVNSNRYGNGTAIFTNSGGAARRYQNEVEVGMIGVNIPIPVPMAFFSFGGWKASLFGDLHMHGMEGVQFYTGTKVVTTRWVEKDAVSSASLKMPTLS
jgi:malonate-semialdehyde dehydrogenase (acetylating) / methylmalonate-semialdehyde dehydrogenase